MKRAITAPSLHLPGKFNAQKKTFSSGPYANILLIVVSQTYPEYIAFWIIHSSEHWDANETPSINPITSLTKGSQASIIAANCCFLASSGNLTLD